VIEDVQFVPNPRLIPIGTEYRQIERDLAVYRESGPYDACGTPDSQRRTHRDSAYTLTGLLTSFNAQATTDAPMSVRALAAYDQEKVTGVVANAVLADVSGRIASRMGREVAQLLGTESGRAVEQALGGTPDAQSDDRRNLAPQRQQGGNNPIASGLKSVGSGFKRLFGGGK
jgi:hypothetical protein